MMRIKEGKRHVWETMLPSGLTKTYGKEEWIDHLNTYPFKDSLTPPGRLDIGCYQEIPLYRAGCVVKTGDKFDIHCKDKEMMVAVKTELGKCFSKNEPFSTCQLKQDFDKVDPPIDWGWR